MQPGEEAGERLLRLGVDAGRGLVEHEQRGLAPHGRRDEGALLRAAREGRERRVGELRQAHVGDRLGHDRAVARAQRADKAALREPARGDDLADRDRALRPHPRALGHVAERRTAGEPVRRLPEQLGGTGLRPCQPEREANERRLAAAVGTGDRHELAFANREVDVRHDWLAGQVAEGDPRELQG